MPTGQRLWRYHPRMPGLVNGMWMRPVKDIGVGRPDHGRGGTYLVVPPRDIGPLPDQGYYVVRMQTYGG